MFTVAALRQLRDGLPVEMNEVERHRALVDRIVGDEIDPFGAEVATMSLIFLLTIRMKTDGQYHKWICSKIILFYRAREVPILYFAIRPSKVRTCGRSSVIRKLSRDPPTQPISALSGVLDARPSGSWLRTARAVYQWRDNMRLSDGALKNFIKKLRLSLFLTVSSKHRLSVRRFSSPANRAPTERTLPPFAPQSFRRAYLLETPERPLRLARRESKCARL